MLRKILFALVGLALSGAVLMTEDVNAQDLETTSTGLQIRDVEVGGGEQVGTGRTAVVHYTGWLWENGAKGEKFDSSVDRGQPFAFPVGAGRVIAGWDEGVASMNVGGKRELIIPPALGYGGQGAGGVIPPNATLLFEVEVLEVQ